MGRKWFVLWHAFSVIAAGVLYFFCVLPRWYELMGEMPRALGMAGRITSGALIGLSALPVVFVWLRARKPELGVPLLALRIRVWSIVAHVLAGVLIIGTAISEIWLRLDTAGQYLFGIYGAAAAIAVLGIFAFYLAFVAELPPPPPKPIKARKPGKRRFRRAKGEEEEAEAQETEEVEDAEDAEATETEDVDEATEDAQEDEPGKTGEVEAAETQEAPTVEAEQPDDTPGGLRNRRPTGKGSHRMRRRRSRGGVAVDDE
ncbi:hypothetical protein ACOJVU_18655 [Mycobacterium sp. THU-M104]|uniref:hypothetical protein n=1 Tax=Mycobacterium sp. THU-M104 TaxID=3410515 RepID=UPI003B9B78E3